MGLRRRATRWRRWLTSDADSQGRSRNDARGRAARRRRRRQSVGDRRALGTRDAVDEPSTTITETLGLGEFATQIDRTLTLADRKGTERDLSDDEIERAIDEIQSTIQRYRR